LVRSKRPEFDVAIVGYGPTGQSLASLLAARGHSVVVFERWPTLYGLPRLIGFDAESARMLQAAGDVNVGLRDSFPIRGYVTYNGDMEPLLTYAWPEDHQCGYPIKTATYQPYIEDAMDQVARARGVQVNTGWRVTGFEQDEEGVSVHTAPWSKEEGAENLKPALTKTVRATYLIGADGASSVVRSELGIEREDLDYRDAWLSVDIERRGVLPEQFMYGISWQVADPGNVIVVVPAGTKRMRFEFQVDIDADNSHLIDQDLGYRYLHERLGLTREQVEIVRLTIYPFSGLIAKEWRRGRIFLAGDAAHLMPPFLGEGAASGMRDSTTLAWKLDLVLRGLADEEFLDTYELERYPHVREHVIHSVELGRVVTERDPDKAAAVAALLLSGEAPPPPPDPILTTGVLLRDREGHPSTLGGHLAPQGYIHLDGRTGRFDDIVGWGFHVVVHDRDPRELLSDEQMRFLDAIHGRAVGVSTEEAPGLAIDVNWTYERYFHDHAIAAFIMRPDFYMFGTVSTLDALPSAIDDLRSQLGFIARESDRSAAAV
jgi:3-(3-hydroxy-phenyl)propionate hydroxylase